jgi:L-rhamnose-H+ transport protein
VLKQAPSQEVWYCYLCGAAWGFGGLTWGLMIRYLGVGLGLALGCGLCSAAGTVVPPMLKGQFAQLLHTSSGHASLGAAVISLVGIVLVGMAGMAKEKELPEEEKKKAVAEYSFKKGIMIAVFSGIMSAGMSFGLQGGPGIQKLAAEVQPTTALAWQGIPVSAISFSAPLPAPSGPVSSSPSRPANPKWGT